MIEGKIDKYSNLKIILFAFMENGFCSLREIEEINATVSGLHNLKIETRDVYAIEYLEDINTTPAVTYATAGVVN